MADTIKIFDRFLSNNLQGNKFYTPLKKHQNVDTQPNPDFWQYIIKPFGNHTKA